MPRYVVLFHQTPEGSARDDHWDFMLESDASLATWALSCEPDASSGIVCDMLENHRVVYLDYEGPISGNRGTVTRWDAGVFDWIYRSEKESRIKLDGSKMRGFVTLKKSDDRWLFKYVPSD